ncbi:ABC transporter substrate-binding protein [Microvirga tunisiensis]|uniref:ABC transporter substrate-binding protein n=1 Tax=Microvirga tunisiensis TaxID=2108360 RepID=A0A5N7MFI5_9HYPH|nr:ABC transporter substrate-binding protein [Microvirga tunisiensis]MPR07504.1 ABC transporter substrate-binding protein [Microvirga tunisiensis]MPR25771.1 ABC transporter substrate-binding protein [Microvirga tunisiensis]
MSSPSRLLRIATGGLLLLSGFFGALAHAQEVDLAPEQKNRVRAEKVEAAIKLIPAGYKFATPGKLTVATVPGNLPFAVYATDTKTPVGNEPDVAQLVADSLGLQLELVPVAWADWPLGIASGRFDAVVHNVTVTEQRKEKLDFSTYRKDLLGFYVANDSKIQSISKPEDVAGLKVIVGASTNQEQILLRWNEANIAKGLKPAEIQYYDDVVVQDLALQSGRADAYLGPNAISAFRAAQGNKTRLVGTFSGGWPVTAEIAVATRKGSGLADAITAAINAQIKSGNYGKTLARWNLTAEAVTESQTNPPGLPKK